MMNLWQCLWRKLAFPPEVFVVIETFSKECIGTSGDRSVGALGLGVLTRVAIGACVEEADPACSMRDRSTCPWRESVAIARAMGSTMRAHAKARAGETKRRTNSPSESIKSMRDRIADTR